MTDNASTTNLKKIFDAEDGFLLQLRTNFEWNKASFKTLIDAMQHYLENTAPEERIERWVAAGFWYTETFTKDWISHPSFPRLHSTHYYEAALARLNDLSYWLFFGESPMQSGTLEPFDA
jgi:hypothetical protein